MKCKKLTIETDGTTGKTFVKIDGKQLGFVQRIEFAADVKDQFVRIFIEQVKSNNGRVVTKNVGGKEVPALETLALEFDRS